MSSADPPRKTDHARLALPESNPSPAPPPQRPVTSPGPGVESGRRAAAPGPSPSAAPLVAIKPEVAPSPRDPLPESQRLMSVATAWTMQQLRSSPPWFYSLVVHMVLLIVLALVTVPLAATGRLSLSILPLDELGFDLRETKVEDLSISVDDQPQPVLTEPLTAAIKPLAAPPEIPHPFRDAPRSSSALKAPAIGIALSGRQPGMRSALLAAYGGTPETQEAVQLGLLWLKRNQRRDGSWSMRGPYSEAMAVENKVAATAMALLAFLGDGHTTQAGEHQKVVERGMRALLKMQDKSGNFFRDGPLNHRLYSQAQATIAICELYGMTQDSQYRAPAQLAIDYAVEIQAPEGGWRYVPKQDSDTSVTGWFVMGLQSALMSDLKVPRETLKKVGEFLDEVEVPGGMYAYRIGEGGKVSMTAEALLCRQYLGWGKQNRRLAAGLLLLEANPIDMADQNVYYWYYATQVMHHMEGDQWHRWNNVMREVLPRHQIKGGRERGSWNAGDDKWGGNGGRLFTTCLSLYMLEVYYRHLPIYSYRK